MMPDMTNHNGGVLSGGDDDGDVINTVIVPPTLREMRLSGMPSSHYHCHINSDIAGMER